eukprot:3005197-Rhodomonas_salina.1
MVRTRSVCRSTATSTPFSTSSSSSASYVSFRSVTSPTQRVSCIAVEGVEGQWKRQQIAYLYALLYLVVPDSDGICMGSAPPCIHASPSSQERLLEPRTIYGILPLLVELAKMSRCCSTCARWLDVALSIDVGARPPWQAHGHPDRDDHGLVRGDCDVEVRTRDLTCGVCSAMCSTDTGCGAVAVLADLGTSTPTSARLKNPCRQNSDCETPTSACFPVWLPALLQVLTPLSLQDVWRIPAVLGRISRIASFRSALLHVTLWRRGWQVMFLLILNFLLGEPRSRDCKPSCNGHSHWGAQLSSSRRT